MRKIAPTLAMLGAVILVGGQTSCSCINREADAADQVLMVRVKAGLKPLNSAVSTKLSTDERSYLDYYGIESPGKHRLGTFRSGDLMLAGQFLYPSDAAAKKGTVIVVHGYFDHACCTVNLTNHLVADGYHVAVYDHPGHGLSDGKRASIRDFESYQVGFSDFLDLVSEELPPPYDVVAHSMGSTVVIDHLDKTGGEPIRRLVFLAPLIKDTKPRGLHVLGAVVSTFNEYLIRPLEENSSDKDYRIFAETDPLQFHCVSTRWAVAFNRWRKKFDDSRPREETPLIIYAGDDATVDNDFARQWLGRVFPGQKTVVIEGAKHQILNEMTPIREEVLKVVSDELNAKS